MSESKTCLTPECGKPAQWKGICRSCYGQAKNLIDKDKTTWDELFELGLCELDAKPFYVAFQKAKQGQK